MIKKLPAAIFSAVILLGSLVLPSAAQPLDLPKGTPILEIGGSVQVTNADGLARFDRDMLEGMGLETVVTSTPWDKGKVRYEGVSMGKLMEAVKAQGKSIRVRALNDYATVIPMEDFTKFDVILALKRDGQYMPIRDKGPLFIIYPFDQEPTLNSQVYYARSAWQVKSIEVEP